MATIVNMRLGSPTTCHNGRRESSATSILDMSKKDSSTMSLFGRWMAKKERRKSLQPHSVEAAAKEKSNLLPEQSQPTGSSPAPAPAPAEAPQTPPSPTLLSAPQRKDGRRLSMLSWKSSKSRQETPPSPVAKTPYVPQHAGSDFGSLAMPTSYRDSTAYKWHHGHGHRASIALGEVSLVSSGKNSQPKVAGHSRIRSQSNVPDHVDVMRRMSLAHSTTLHPHNGGTSQGAHHRKNSYCNNNSSNSNSNNNKRNSTATSTGVSFSSVVWSSGGVATSRQQSRRESVATTASDAHSSHSGSGYDPMATRKRRSSIGQKVADYIRPPRRDSNGMPVYGSAAVKTVPVIIDHSD